MSQAADSTADMSRHSYSDGELPPQATMSNPSNSRSGASAYEHTSNGLLFSWDPPVIDTNPLRLSPDFYSASELEDPNEPEHLTTRNRSIDFDAERSQASVISNAPSRPSSIGTRILPYGSRNTDEPSRAAPAQSDYHQQQPPRLAGMTSVDHHNIFAGLSSRSQSRLSRSISLRRRPPTPFAQPQQSSQHRSSAEGSDDIILPFDRASNASPTNMSRTSTAMSHRSYLAATTDSVVSLASSSATSSKRSLADAALSPDANPSARSRRRQGSAGDGDVDNDDSNHGEGSSTATPADHRAVTANCNSPIIIDDSEEDDEEEEEEEDGSVTSIAHAVHYPQSRSKRRRTRACSRNSTRSSQDFPDRDTLRSSLSPSAPPANRTGDDTHTMFPPALGLGPAQADDAATTTTTAINSQAGTVGTPPAAAVPPAAAGGESVDFATDVLSSPAFRPRGTPTPAESPSLWNRTSSQSHAAPTSRNQTSLEWIMYQLDSLYARDGRSTQQSRDVARTNSTVVRPPASTSRAGTEANSQQEDPAHSGSEEARTTSQRSLQPESPVIPRRPTSSNSSSSIDELAQSLRNSVDSDPGHWRNAADVLDERLLRLQAELRTTSDQLNRWRERYESVQSAHRRAISTRSDASDRSRSLAGSVAENELLLSRSEEDQSGAPSAGGPTSPVANTSAVRPGRDSSEGEDSVILLSDNHSATAAQSHPDSSSRPRRRRDRGSSTDSQTLQIPRLPHVRASSPFGEVFQPHWNTAGSTQQANERSVSLSVQRQQSARPSSPVRNVENTHTHVSDDSYDGGINGQRPRGAVRLRPFRISPSNLRANQPNPTATAATSSVTRPVRPFRIFAQDAASSSEEHPVSSSSGEEAASARIERSLSQTPMLSAGRRGRREQQRSNFDSSTLHSQERAELELLADQSRSADLDDAWENETAQLSNSSSVYSRRYSRRPVVEDVTSSFGSAIETGGAQQQQQQQPRQEGYARDQGRHAVDPPIRRRHNTLGLLDSDEEGEDEDPGGAEAPLSMSAHRRMLRQVQRRSILGADIMAEMAVPRAQTHSQQQSRGSSSVANEPSGRGEGTSNSSGPGSAQAMQRQREEYHPSLTRGSREIFIDTVRRRQREAGGNRSPSSNLAQPFSPARMRSETRSDRLTEPERSFRPEEPRSRHSQQSSGPSSRSGESSMLSAQDRYGSLLDGFGGFGAAQQSYRNMSSFHFGFPGTTIARTRTFGESQRGAGSRRYEFEALRSDFTSSHHLASMGYRSSEALQDQSIMHDPRNYLQDDAFRSDYESLWSLGDFLGDVRPRVASRSVVKGLRTFAFRDVKRQVAEITADTTSQTECNGGDGDDVLLQQQKKRRDRKGKGKASEDHRDDNPPRTATIRSARRREQGVSAPVREMTAEERLLLSSMTTMQCPICLGSYEDEEVLCASWCHHGFHEECLKRWLEKADTCPLCRSRCPSDMSCHEDGTAELVSVEIGSRSPHTLSLPPPPLPLIGESSSGGRAGNNAGAGPRPLVPANPLEVRPRTIALDDSTSPSPPPPLSPSTPPPPPSRRAPASSEESARFFGMVYGSPIRHGSF